MHSLSKTVVSPDTAQAIIAAAFGSGSRVRAFEELKDGYFNAAYAITLADGLRCVLKVAPPDAVRVLRYERDILAAEVAVMRLVRQYTELPVPAILGYDTSRRLVESDFYLMAFIEGAPLNKVRKELSPDEQHAVDREIGRYLRQMNEIAGPAFGYFSHPAPPGYSWRETFVAMLDGVLADGQDGLRPGVALPLAYAALRERVAVAATILDDVTAPRLVHWDLWDGNIFVDPATKRVNGIIDFERALWGDPLMEATFVFAPPEGLAAFTEGYGQALLDTPAQARRRILYNIYLYLIMIIECAYRQYETHDQENWARGRLAGELARLEN
jgi:aminoglycoside phosphotransferase (APT) family kinase protein